MRISDWSSDVCSSDLAAIFGGEQRLHLGIVEAFEDRREIPRHSEHYRQRRLDVADPVGIDQPGMDLVPGVERHPAAVDVEPAGADDVAADFLEDDLAVRSEERLLGEACVRTCRSRCAPYL